VATPLPVRLQAPEMSVETLTPQDAKALLDANDSNRTVRKRLVITYARDMAAGRWQFTGEAIKVAEDGVLLDGQHRLMAIVESGTPIPMLVIRGLSHAAQAAMDTGAKRTAGDALSLRGEKTSALLASVAKMILSDGSRLDVTPSTIELIEVVEANDTLRWVLEHFPPFQLKHLTSPTVVGYAYWRLHQIDPFQAAEFFDRLTTLVGLPAGSPILALHRRLTAHVRNKSSRQHRREALFYIFTAWNAWRRGEDRALVKLAYAGGQVAVPEPK
jgi:hypothetical protein